MTYTAEIVLNVKLMQNSQQFHSVRKEKKPVTHFCSYILQQRRITNVAWHQYLQYNSKQACLKSAL